MKKIILSAVIMGAVLIAGQTKAQPGFRVNVQVGLPAWLPTGYASADYYYLPDVQAYYYVPQRQFIYMDGGRWTFASCLPSRYSNYDLYHGYKVAVNEPRPYLHDEIYRERFRRPVYVDRHYDNRYNHGYDNHAHNRDRWR